MTTGISYPASLPAFLAAGHAREPEPVFALAEMDTGAPRLRRRFTVAPEFQEVSTWLSQAEFDTFYDFFEDALQAGALTFNVPIGGPSYSSGIEWWEARFAAPYSTPYKNGGSYVVSARLRLIAGPFETRPVGPLAAEGEAIVTGDADLTVAHTLAAEGVASATGDANVSVAIRLAAEGTASATGDARLVDPAALAAEGTASASGDASLTAAVTLAAEGTGSATGAADLTVTTGTADVDFARSWMGLNHTQASVAASDDALAAEWMGL